MMTSVKSSDGNIDYKPLDLCRDISTLSTDLLTIALILLMIMFIHTKSYGLFHVIRGWVSVGNQFFFADAQQILETVNEISRIYNVFSNLENHNLLLESLTFFVCIFHWFKIIVSDWSNKMCVFSCKY